MNYVANPVQVEAWRIEKIKPGKAAGEYHLTLEGGGKANVDSGMTARHTPSVGDYLVRQADGYTYLNPKDVFERKYRQGVLGPAHNDAQIEAAVKAKGLTAPRVTKEHIDQLVAGLTVKMHHFEGTTVTVAIAMLPNGFVVATEMSAAVSPQNFDAEIGAKVVFDKVLAAARENLWELEGYALKKQLEATHG